MSQRRTHEFLAQALWSILGAALVVLIYLFATRRPLGDTTPLPTAQRMSHEIDLLELRDVPLDRALQIVAAKVGITFRVNWNAIRPFEAADKVVDLRLTDISARIALDNIAWQLHCPLATRAEEDHVVISTEHELPPAKHAVLRLYDVEDLVEQSAAFNALF